MTMKFGSKLLLVLPESLDVDRVDGHHTASERKPCRDEKMNKINRKLLKRLPIRIHAI